MQGEQHHEKVVRIAVRYDTAELPQNFGGEVFESVAVNEIVWVIRAEAQLFGGCTDNDDGVIRRGEVDAVALVYFDVIRNLSILAVHKSLNVALFGIGIGGDEALLQLIGFHVHIGKGLAELVELIAGMVVRRLFDVVAVEHFDWRGELCTGAERDEHADAEHKNTGE